MELGVIAITEIPTGARSSPFELSCVSGKIRRDKLNLPLQVGIWQNGEITPVGSVTGTGISSTIFWPKLIMIAPDCHVQNVRICRWQGTTVVLQATRLILTGQPLFLWFGEDLLINDLGIPPYLSPSNIRGGNSYICNKCESEFEAPNLLKIHLASDCGSISMDILWNRLSKVKTQSTLLSLNFLSAINSIPLVSTVRAPCFLPPMGIVLPESDNSTSVSTNNTSGEVGGLPYSIAQVQNQRQRPQHCNKSNVNANNNNNGNLSTNQHRKDEQAHLESLVSNMGKAKNGHVCLYCGKLYSRKYGLKIHIRTHTGYKPLECRICHRPFGDPSNLNKHVRLHSDGNTPYRCEYCGKVLVRRRDLDRHIRSRHGGLNENATKNQSRSRVSTITSSGLNT